MYRIGPSLLQSRSLHRTSRLSRHDSGKLREPLGRESEKSSSDNALPVLSEIPERFTTLAKRSEGKRKNGVQRVFHRPFTSDSRGREFFRRFAYFGLSPARVMRCMTRRKPW
jgi:hypothetical protein